MDARCFATEHEASDHARRMGWTRDGWTVVIRTSQGWVPIEVLQQ